MDSGLAKQFAEAATFAVYFSASPAVLSTPHLYVSALSTWPGESEPCWGWRNRFPGIPWFTNASRSGISLMTLRVGSGVNSVAFSTDGTRIVSGSDDKSVRVWDVLMGEQLNVLNGHTELVTLVTFSMDGMRIVSGSCDESVRVWDTLTAEQLNVLNGHTDWVNSAAFLMYSTRIVSGSDDKSVRVWDASTGKQLNVLNGHTESVTSVAFSTDGTRIVSGSFDNSVRVWEALTGKQLDVLNGHTSSVNSVAFLTDGARIISGSHDNSVRVWDMGPHYIREQANDPSPGYTGWLLSTDRRAYLMFVPLDARLPDSFNILTIPQSAASSVDFTNATIGPRWRDCYCP